MSLEDRIRKVLFVLGIAILCAIPFWLWLDAPHLLGIPKDFTYRANVISSDNFYNVDTETFSGEQYSQNVLSYETVSSSSSSSIIKNSFEARTTDGTLVFAVDRLYGIDRKTGKQLAGFGGEDREGYLFAPAHLKEGQPFTYWHVNYDGPANMQFAGVEYLYGLKVFRY